VKWIGAVPAAGLTLLMATSGHAASRDIDGRPLAPFDADGHTQIVFFVATDCPISNAYAPEIQRVCKAYDAKGVRCTLSYEDEHVDAAAVRKHMDAFGYRGTAATIDTSRALAKKAGASITPQATLVDARGQVRYRGRIDNFYAALGKPRQQVTSHDLIDALDAVLAGKPVTQARTEPIGCFITGTAF